MLRSINNFKLNIELPLESLIQHFCCLTKNNKNCHQFQGVIQVWMAITLCFYINMLQVLFKFFGIIFKIIISCCNVFRRITDVNLKIFNPPLHVVYRKHSIISTISVQNYKMNLSLIFNFLLDTKGNTFAVSWNNVIILFNFVV